MLNVVFWVGGGGGWGLPTIFQNKYEVCNKNTISFSTNYKVAHLLRDPRSDV